MESLRALHLEEVLGLQEALEKRRKEQEAGWKRDVRGVEESGRLGSGGVGRTKKGRRKSVCLCVFPDMEAGRLEEDGRRGPGSSLSAEFAGQ